MVGFWYEVLNWKSGINTKQMRLICMWGSLLPQWDDPVLAKVDEGLYQ